MTTVAYKNGIIAADTLGSRGNYNHSRCVKIAKRGPLLAGGSGSSAYLQTFFAWFRNGCVGPAPAMSCPKEDDVWAEGFVVLPNDQIGIFGAYQWAINPYAGFYASGSGAPLALGAMGAGATAEEAVRVAIMFDPVVAAKS